MMFAIQPVRRAAIVIFIRPTAWKSFSKDKLSIIMIEKEKAMFEY